MSATIRTATPTVTFYQQLAEQFSEELDDVAALIPNLESPHPLTANFVRSHVNVPFEFLRTAIFAVEEVPELRAVNKLDVDAALATLQFIEAFRPVYDKLMRLARSLKFTMSSRKAHLAADALQIYWIGRGLARDRRSANVVPIVAALSRDLDIDAESFECFAPRRRERVGVIEPSELAHPVVQQHSERAGDVVVARTGGAQNLRRLRDQALARARQHAERFQRDRHVVAVQAEVPMLPLGEDLHELLRRDLAERKIWQMSKRSNDERGGSAAGPKPGRNSFRVK